jgi:hypothetical protein
MGFRAPEMLITHKSAGPETYPTNHVNRLGNYTLNLT